MVCCYASVRRTVQIVCENQRQSNTFVQLLKKLGEYTQENTGQYQSDPNLGLYAMY